jgi:hypothetical protein
MLLVKARYRAEVLTVFAPLCLCYNTARRTKEWKELCQRAPQMK